MNRLLTGLGATVAAVITNALLASSSFAFTFVNTELVLSVDVSGSVDDAEFNLQRQGYANAFRDDELIDIIEEMEHGIAVTMQYWSSQTASAIGWHHITNANSAYAFADAIEAADRPFDGATNIAAAINSASNLLLTNTYQGDRLVIDVSGDGRQNTTLAGTHYCSPYPYNGRIYNNDLDPVCYNLVASARDTAISQGITINGLPILTDVATLDTYYQNYAIGGEDAFLQVAATFSDFETAVKDKIKREIQNTTLESVPEPTMTLGLILLGLGGGISALKKRDRA